MGAKEAVHKLGRWSQNPFQTFPQINDILWVWWWSMAHWASNSVNSQTEVIVWISTFDTAVSPKLQGLKADSQVTPSPSLMWLCTLYLILPLCPLATISRTEEWFIQKADTGTRLSGDRRICRCFPVIACNLSSFRKKFVPCRAAFDGYCLFIVSRLRRDLNTEFSQFGNKEEWCPLVGAGRLECGRLGLVGCHRYTLLSTQSERRCLESQ